MGIHTQEEERKNTTFVGLFLFLCFLNTQTLIIYTHICVCALKIAEKRGVVEAARKLAEV